MSAATAAKVYKVTGWHLEFQDGSSDKFYSVFALDDGHCILNWGRRGTSGQTKIEEYTAAEALIIAKRQVYAKAGKGYKMLTDEFSFVVDEQTCERVIRNNWGADYLTRAMREALLENEFTQQQRLVTTHYDTFIEQTNQVLDAAAKGEEFEPLLERWERLAEAWRELDDKHTHAQTAVNLVQQVVGQRLMRQ